MEVDESVLKQDELFSHKFGNLKFKIYSASILRLKVDAIVNAANESLAHNGGVAYVIAEAAGQRLNDDCRRHINDKYRVLVTENIITSAGKLGYKSVIHAVGPIWHKYW